MKPISFFLLLLLLLSSLAFGKDKTKIFDTDGKYFGEMEFDEVDFNRDGRPEKLLYFDSLIDFSGKKIEQTGPKGTDDIKLFSFKNFFLLVSGMGNQIYIQIIDSNKKFLGIFENQKEIRDWTKAYTGIKDNEAWVVKYNLGYVFKKLKIKENKIYLLTGDGGSGSTGGYNIEHVFEIKDGKPVTLVSRFVPNTEKDKRVKEMQRGTK